jgi:hypothetical protein
MTNRIMTDWQAIAKARGIEASDKVTGPLEALEAQFRALTPSIRLETEPVNFYVLPLDGEDR